MQTRVEFVSKRGKRRVMVYDVAPRGNYWVLRPPRGQWAMLNDVLRDCTAFEWNKSKGYMVIYD